jgi:hypothetical protein
LAVAAHGLAAETLAAQGLAVFCAHGFAGAQGFTAGLAAHGLAGTHGFFDFGAQGFAVAAEVFPKIWEASWSEGPSKVMAKSHGSNEKIAPLNQCGPGSHQKKSAA